MRSYKIQNGKLVLEEVNFPSITENEVLVKIHAASLNYRDILVTEGIGPWRSPDNRIPVSDGAGEIMEVGKLVKGFKKGDRVTTVFSPNWIEGKLSSEKLKGRLGGPDQDGVLAEYVALPENAVCKFPEYLLYTEAATLPCAALTAWNAVIEQSTLKTGESILLLGTGGVSCFALQFSKLASYQIIHTSGSSEKLEKVKALGAHFTINYKENKNWVNSVMDVTNGEGVSQVVDVIGGNHINQSLKCIKSEGLISMIGVLDGTKGDIDTGMIMTKAARIQGVEVGSTEMYKRMLHAMEIQKIAPIINKVFSFEQTLEAFAYLKTGNHLGKICIQF